MSTLVNPDCRDGKHSNCRGLGWDTEQDDSTLCPCECHTTEMKDDFEPFDNPQTTAAMQAVYDRIRELGGDPALIALADRVAARVRNEVSECESPFAPDREDGA